MSVISHRPPPLQQKHMVKICFLPFHEAFDSFSFFKNRAPRNNPGMHSWTTSRNALLGDLQEHTPGQVFEPTLVLSLNVRYLYIGINANVNLLSIL